MYLCLPGAMCNKSRLRELRIKYIYPIHNIMENRESIIFICIITIIINHVK